MLLSAHRQDGSAQSQGGTDRQTFHHAGAKMITGIDLIGARSSFLFRVPAFFLVPRALDQS